MNVTGLAIVSTALIVNLAGLALIGFVVWWFWLARPRVRVVADQGPIEIRVRDGVYDPPSVRVPVGQAVTLRFLREDPNPCAERVSFDDLGINTELALGRPTDVTLRVERPGEYTFACDMGMYRGRLLAG